MLEQYIPPEIWTHDAESGGKWANINRPVSGATHDKALPIGEHPLQLYSMGTPNGQKITIMLEELLALGKDAQYDAHMIKIGEGDQFSSGFVTINPNSKIPVLVDNSYDTPLPVFESASILVYLAEKFDVLLPKDTVKRAQVMNWLFWLHGSAPYLGGGFGHFYNYAPEKFEYAIDRFTMEIKRQLDVLDKQLAKNEFIAGDELSIADIATWPWYGNLVLGELYSAKTFLQVDDYTHVQRWAKAMLARPAFQRGRIVNKTWGEAWEQLENRHNAEDIDKVLALQPE
ncbi:glutathione-dependent disulfide-bond oxidoreductase [Colwellia sp. 4_MG-2023]|jgi:GST-like protein|uniref:glutathione-dependent disulfide-bond oxidoreductase n=1 Tax=unclassified Colwellia TaxID=196834 RepID=UPI001C0971C1|nr:MULTISPECIES: glutathione-dependent disulfide-bond oxidoreductase [unclassified Colwellia]MBU2923595.1 glutathione-dependent disulfide-bond oxidoreductase [Colwellia sp. C2M11]MDO6486157.1 glutathione-dependent disulfide-bond oxidoreductase [Colwellia sp. 6_MG-2023]MDO6505883.1 glutathione-dependent disulfide-bond oxidoreductase [Colwellia sp. 5_MG-2023]MDO6554564.1 glutathione-dependent disulfide-bond oxidoreductase [Colwellia sp. 4_MG-2023]MDO6652306.1 glutathione-dependent disulfide-bond